MADHRFVVKRVYEPAGGADGFRVLVDRLWPRGVNRDKARIDLWLKEIAPSDHLRKEFHGHPDKWSEFVKAYRAELKSETGQAAIAQLMEASKKKTVTLLYAARDEEHNNAVALQSFLVAKN